MDETTYRISYEDQEVHVSFDLRDQENCFIELSFSKDDVLNIINMGLLHKNKIDVAGIEGVASLTSGNADDRQICFNYRNRSAVESGTVLYSYKKLSALLNEAFTKLNYK
jgi:hypothetical protein